jgi:glycosyltransferase involved in cell wall biosynthesis
MVQLCIIVPVYNHGAGAVALAQKLKSYELTTFLIDDGSDAETRDELDSVAVQNDWITVLRHAENGGKGAAVLTGLHAAWAAGFTHALQIDSDGQHNSNDIPEMIALATAHPDAVITGWPRYDESVPKGRLIARYLTHVWVWVETLSFDIKDSMCGFRVYPLKPVIKLTEHVNLGRRMDFDPEILVRLHWEGLPILSHPTTVIYPAGGTSNFRLWHDNYLITRMHTRLVLGLLWQLIFRRPPKLAKT